MRTGEVQADAVVQKVPTEHHSEFLETVSYSRPVYGTHILADKQCYMSSAGYAATKYNLTQTYDQTTFESEDIYTTGPITIPEQNMPISRFSIRNANTEFALNLNNIFM